MVARGITEQAAEGISRVDLERFRKVVSRMTKNLDRIER